MSAGSPALARVYAAKTGEELREGYDGWAADYDAEMAALGYRLPELGAAFLARHIPKGEGPILDAGAGTGRAGEALAILGYPRLVGIDMSQEMLRLAGARGVYERLERAVLGEPLGFADGAFAAVIATGVFTCGHAPASSFEELIRVTRPGGAIVFTIRDELIGAGGFGAVLDAHERAGRWGLVERSRPARSFTSGEAGVWATVFVYRVAA